MNIGKKITLLKDGAGFKSFKEFGKFLDINGDWLNDLSKKQEITTVDITRLQRIASRFNVSMDWLLSNDADENKLNDRNIYPEDDLASMLDRIQGVLKEGKVKFKDTLISKDVADLVYDSIDIVRSLIKQN